MMEESEAAAGRGLLAAPHSAASSSQPQASVEKPLWRWLLQDVGQRTVGVARVDLVRPRLPSVEAGGSIWSAQASDGMVGAPSVGRGSTYSRMQAPEYRGGSSAFRAGQREQGGLLDYGASRGARLKVMRSIHFGWHSAAPQAQEEEERVLVGGTSAAGRFNRAIQKQSLSPAGPWGLQPALLSFGVGVNFELDSMEASLHTRLKLQDWLTLKLTPVPALKLHKSIQLGSSPLSLRVRYEVPLEALDDPLRPPARLLIRLENDVGSGVRLSTSGVDFDPRLISLGSNAGVRFAGAALFPRQIPVQEGEKLLDWQVDRLGLIWLHTSLQA